MLVQNLFHLDCNPVIPECGYQGDKCIQEIRSVLKGMRGVSEVSTGKHGETTGLISHGFFRTYALTLDFTGMRLFLKKKE